MPKSKPNKQKIHRSQKPEHSLPELELACIEQWKHVFQAISNAYPLVKFTDYGTNETYRQAHFSLRYNLASVEGTIVDFLFERMIHGEAPPKPKNTLLWITLSRSMMPLVPKDIDITPPIAKIQYREFKQ